jgi:hypothetical protein
LAASAREVGNGADDSDALQLQGDIASERGDLKAARDFYAQALAGHTARGDQAGIAGVLANSAELEFMYGNAGEAVRMISDALRLEREEGSRFRLVALQSNDCAYRIALQDLDGARASGREAIRLAREVQSEFGIAIALQHVALIGALQDRRHGAARLLGYVDARFKVLAYQRESTEQWGYGKLMAALRAEFSDAEIEELGAEGAAWTEEQAVEASLET